MEEKISEIQAENLGRKDEVDQNRIEVERLTSELKLTEVRESDLQVERKRLESEVEGLRE